MPQNVYEHVSYFVTDISPTPKCDEHFQQMCYQTQIALEGFPSAWLLFLVLTEHHSVTLRI